MICVAITQMEADDPRRAESRDALDVRWHHLLRYCGIVAVPLPNEPRLAVAQAAACGCQGLILSGGGDLTLDGGPRSRRERTEEAAYAWATAREMPVLGVCRGMQVLLLSAGGRLKGIAGHVATRHVIDAQGKTRTVNSFHHFAALDVPDDFEIVARSGTVVEAVVHRTSPVRGIMWHPERESPFDSADIDMIRELFCSAV